jgi:hypothetical protein
LNISLFNWQKPISPAEHLRYSGPTVLPSFIHPTRISKRIMRGNMQEGPSQMPLEL